MLMQLIPNLFDIVVGLYVLVGEWVSLNGNVGLAPLVSLQRGPYGRLYVDKGDVFLGVRLHTANAISQEGVGPQEVRSGHCGRCSTWSGVLHVIIRGWGLGTVTCSVRRRVELPLAG